MARAPIDERLEEDADRKHLHGQARKRYIGGAWHRIMAAVGMQSPRERKLRQAYHRAAQSERKRSRRNRERAATAADRELARFQRDSYRAVVKALTRTGGVRPFSSRDSRGRRYFQAEYETLPSTVRRGRGRLDMDQAASLLTEELPELGIGDLNDLLGFFDRNRTKKLHRRR